MTEPVMVHVRHLRTVQGLTARRGYCVSGTRNWFASHGLSWRQFVRQGLPASAFRATGDGLAIRLAEHAEQEARNG